jgi:hypothetical protein
LSSNEAHPTPLSSTGGAFVVVAIRSDWIIEVSVMTGLVAVEVLKFLTFSSFSGSSARTAFVGSREKTKINSPRYYANISFIGLIFCETNRNTFE